MSLSRTAVERVLLTHGIGKAYRLAPPFDDMTPTLVDDLCALGAPPQPSPCAHCGTNPPTYCYTCWEGETRRPQLSRDALEKILARYLAGIGHGEGRHIKFKQFADDLMAFAQGTDTRKWCSHMNYNNGHWTLMDRTWHIPSGMTWEYCPLCGSKRPPEAG